MVRGTFANVRLINKLVDQVGPFTMHLPSKQKLRVYEAAELYKKENN